MIQKLPVRKNYHLKTSPLPRIEIGMLGSLFHQRSLTSFFSYQKEYIFFYFYSIYICGGYNLILSVKECYKLNLSNTTQGWVPIAPLIKGRFNFKMVAANGFIYAVGGEGPFSEHDDIEVHCKYTFKLTQTNKQTKYLACLNLLLTYIKN